MKLFKEPQFTREYYERLIKELDEILTMVRSYQMDSPATGKGKWDVKLNNLLDERLRLMRQRDAVPA